MKTLVSAQPSRDSVSTVVFAQQPESGQGCRDGVRSRAREPVLAGRRRRHCSALAQHTISRAGALPVRPEVLSVVSHAARLQLRPGGLEALGRRPAVWCLIEGSGLVAGSLRSTPGDGGDHGHNSNQAGARPPRRVWESAGRGVQTQARRRRHRNGSAAAPSRSARAACSVAHVPTTKGAVRSTAQVAFPYQTRARARVCPRFRS
ncbi:uncharacterized protein CC84DRAFT_385012 [Paraphaeosphaeria sporulosa]|uniref:Uncharacterized protein n=1 Tax=Paraphaeosphaeria sporulosa TaxID=1460663 RepID=A0A177BUP2_9PLEO|nr:uncharacterized protein CC84DRAFT_385012 [Paraphaeosphaeria sporulosa]OAF99183.1 hypothetical protein CC84DRAFT_385012 [Paraphaeosphaeria sporulosa]